jgi:hypothetical protein
VTWLGWRLRLAWGRHRRAHAFWLVRVARANGDTAAEDRAWERLDHQSRINRSLEMAEP